MKKSNCLMLAFSTQTLTMNQNTAIEGFYLEHFWEQFRLKATNDAMEPGFELDDEYKEDVMDEWSAEWSEEDVQNQLFRIGEFSETSEGRPDPPFVEAHIQFYLEKVQQFSDEENLDEPGPNGYAPNLFELAMGWCAFEAVHSNWVRCSCGRIEMVDPGY